MGDKLCQNRGISQVAMNKRDIEVRGNVQNVYVDVTVAPEGNKGLGLRTNADIVK